MARRRRRKAVRSNPMSRWGSWAVAIAAAAVAHQVTRSIVFKAPAVTGDALADQTALKYANAQADGVAAAVGFGAGALARYAVSGGKFD